jgi:hypothetical protein
VREKVGDVNRSVCIRVFDAGRHGTNAKKGYICNSVIYFRRRPSVRA